MAQRGATRSALRILRPYLQVVSTTGEKPLTYPGRANHAAGVSPILHTIALLNSGVGGAMLPMWRRIASFILAGLLMLHLTNAIIDGGRAQWLMVAIIALVLALSLWQQRTREQ